MANAGEIWVSRMDTRDRAGLRVIMLHEGGEADTFPAHADLITAWDDLEVYAEHSTIFNEPVAIEVRNVPHAPGGRRRVETTWYGSRIWA